MNGLEIRMQCARMAAGDVRRAKEIYEFVTSSTYEKRMQMRIVPMIERQDRPGIRSEWILALENKLNAGIEATLVEFENGEFAIITSEPFENGK